MSTPPDDTGSTAEPVAELTIDELAAHTRVPSRTIRFYQSKGVLQKPGLRGRVAVYGKDHVERLALIGDLQDRGLSIRAIRDLVARLDKGDLDLGEWLGLEARLQEPWTEDEALLLKREELASRFGEERTGQLSELVRLGLVTRQGDAFLVPSPSLLHAALQLRDAGVELPVARAGLDLTRRHLSRLAQELVALYVKSAGDGFGSSGSADDLGRAFASLRAVGLETVQRVFAQEMQTVLRELVQSGAAAKVPRRRGT